MTIMKLYHGEEHTPGLPDLARFVLCRVRWSLMDGPTETS